jgi:signal transduction histidine kinase/ActR/RegA family two-component response regulator
VNEVRVLEVTTPVVRRVSVARDPFEDSELAVGSGAARARREQVGWVRVALSLDRVEAAVGTAARMGLLVLLIALLLGTVALALLVRLMVRPLHEASDLAQEIAAGRLDRRIPVRSEDELGTLAQSLNSMASSLLDARRRVEAEAEALRVATAAMVEIGRGVRSARDPAAVFDVVAREIRGVTGCDGVALAAPEGDTGMVVFRQLDPPLPWGRLEQLPAPARDLTWTEIAGTPAPLVLDLDARGDALCAALRDEGFGSALLVPLATEGSPLPVLLLASRQPVAFASAEVDVVGGLASHLSAALQGARLNDRLHDAFGELQRTHDYLVRSEMLRVAGEMASGVAHEFNNVLGAILGRAQLLCLQAASGALPTEELIESLAIIERAALDGRETGRRLRQFGRAQDSGSVEPVDLDRALRDAVEFTRPRWENEAQAAGRRIDISVESRPGIVVRARGHEMREVFTNLILNAVDALPQGGHVRLAAFHDSGRVVTTVEDDGVGMTEEVRQRAFEPFFSTKGPGGTGLGMSLVYGILQRCDGTIDVQSSPGEGTRITVSFPAAMALAAPAEPEPLPDTQPNERLLDVLVVDDESTVRDVLRDMVSALGHRVVACASGHEALEQMRPGRFHLVLTDLGMPGITGWKLAEAVRQRDPATVIVFVTGWGEEVNADAVRKVGADRVVTKPFSLEDILETTRIAAARAGTDRAEAA